MKDVVLRGGIAGGGKGEVGIFMNNGKLRKIRNGELYKYEYRRLEW